MLRDLVRVTPLKLDMPKKGYVQDRETGQIRLRTPKLRGKAAVKAAKRERHAASRG